MRCCLRPGPSACEARCSGSSSGGHARSVHGRSRPRCHGRRDCIGRDGAPTPGLSAIGRPTEDSVIGNDTLGRTLHPHADRWARRVSASVAAGRGDAREPAAS